MNGESNGYLYLIMPYQTLLKEESIGGLQEKEMS